VTNLKSTTLLTLLIAGLLTTPVLGLPLIDVGAGLQTDLQLISGSTSGVALDVNANAHFHGPIVSGRYWRSLGTGLTYGAAELGGDISPLPFFQVIPSVGLASLQEPNSAQTLGATAGLTGRVSAFMVPIALSAFIKGSYLNNQLYYPYGAEFYGSPFPFINIHLGYKGFAGGGLLGAVAGPSLGLEFGF
jgi:hypothetical protein